MNRQRGYITLILYGIAALAVLGMLYGVYAWIDSSWETSAGIKRGEANIQAKWDEANRLQREKEAKAAEAATVKLESENGKARVIYKTITRKVDRIVDRPIYRTNLCLDSDGLQLARDALSGSLATSLRVDKRMPEPDAP